jgi:hypothetical protein
MTAFVSGFVAARRGLLDHLRDGRITLLEYGTLIALIQHAHSDSGLWIGSAKAFSCICGAGDIGNRQARHLLEQLERKSYIKRFATPRKKGNYPILVHKYLCTSGAYAGKMINAVATMDWRHPLFESIAEHCSQHGLEHSSQHGPQPAPLIEGDIQRSVSTAANRGAAVPPHQGRAAELFSGKEWPNQSKAARVRTELEVGTGPVMGVNKLRPDQARRRERRLQEETKSRLVALARDPSCPLYARKKAKERLDEIDAGTTQ